MTIAILKQEPGQTVARPYARASTVDEVGELLAGWWRRHAPDRPGPVLALNCVDSDTPVLERGGTRFWCFTEEVGQ